MNEVVVDKKVIKTGGSLGFRLTKELKMIDVKEGDIITVCLRRKNE